MKKIMLLLLVIMASSELFGQNSDLGTRYIRDELLVPLRSGKSSQHRIVHKGLLSGTAVTVLEVSEDKDYSLVRTRKGTEGWIQTQYLKTEPAARDLLKTANKKIAQLEQKNNTLTEQINEIKSNHNQAQQELNKLSKNHSNAEQELAEIKEISANAIQLNQDNQRLLNDNQMLKKEVDILTTDNQRLNDSEENDAFLNGAFAVLIGVMITLLVPRLSPKKRTDWA